MDEAITDETAVNTNTVSTPELFTLASYGRNQKPKYAEYVDSNTAMGNGKEL